MKLKPGRMRLGKVSETKTPKPVSKRTPKKKRARLEALPKKRTPKIEVIFTYPDEDLLEFRPKGDNPKAVAARNTFDAFPTEVKWGGEDAIKYVCDSLESYGFKPNPGNLVYLRWMLCTDSTMGGQPTNGEWPYPKSAWGSPSKRRAWEAKREFGRCFSHFVLTKKEYADSRDAANIDKIALEKKWKLDIAKERGRVSVGFSFPKKSKE